MIEFLSVVVVALLICSRDNPSYKLTWQCIILVFPLFGVFIYFIAVLISFRRGFAR